MSLLYFKFLIRYLNGRSSYSPAASAHNGRSAATPHKAIERVPSCPAQDTSRARAGRDPDPPLLPSTPPSVAPPGSWSKDSARLDRITAGAEPIRQPEMLAHSVVHIGSHQRASGNGEDAARIKNT